MKEEIGQTQPQLYGTQYFSVRIALTGQYYQQALHIQEDVLGPGHPDVAETLNNLARLYRAMGAYEKAEPLYQSTLHIRESTFGIDHPLVAQSYYSLAKLYHSLGNYIEAEKLLNKLTEPWH